MRSHVEHHRGNEEFVKRICDQMDQMKRQHRIILTPFFSPDQSALVETVCGKHVQYVKDGGYEGAERCRFAFLPDDRKPDVQITILKATYASAFGVLHHRDVLGALMQLGMEREKIGDILVSEDDLHVLCDASIENYLIANLVKIKRSKVSLSPVKSAIKQVPKIIYEHKIVSSLRLDTIVATLAKMSRAKAQTLILSGLVKVNHVVLEQTAFLCDNNSAISIRGYGRFHFSEVIKKTKKNHLVIAIGAYQ